MGKLYAICISVEGHRQTGASELQVLSRTDRASEENAKAFRNLIPPPLSVEIKKLNTAVMHSEGISR